MRTRLDELVDENLRSGRAVPALTVYSFSAACAVVQAAEQLDRGLALLVAPKRFALSDGERFVRCLRGLADEARVPVSVQFDHAVDLSQIRAAVAAGADAVLADGSTLTWCENADFVAEARAGLPAGTVMEAELGAVAGDEDQSTDASAGGFTDPSVVESFLERSGAELLAVSVGNVHGSYSGEPHLRWGLIDDIAQAATVPLTLHGASGLARADLGRAIGEGFGKINVNTELRGIVLDAWERTLPVARAAGDDMLSVERAVLSALRDFTRGLILDLSVSGT